MDRLPDLPPEDAFVTKFRRDERDRRMRQSVTGVGLEFSITVAVFTAIGFGLDTLAGTYPGLMLGGFFFGLVVAFWRLVAFAQQQNRRDAASRTKDGRP